MEFPIPAERPKLENETTWFDLPLEMREMIIKEMDAKTRCVFTKCSKQCEKEVKESKDYLPTIRFSRNHHPELYIAHEYDHFSYVYEFIDFANLAKPQSMVVYKTSETACYCEEEMEDCVIKWTKMEEGNAEQVRLRYINEYIDKYHKNIIFFILDDKEFPTDKCDMSKLKNLQNIEQDVKINLFQDGFLKLSQFVNADLISADDTNFTFEQIIQLRASFILLKSDDFDEENISMLLKMLKKGECGRSWEDVHVKFVDSPIGDLETY